MARNKTTPMLDQYLSIKQNYPDSILLFRLGDFYETFNEDAKIAADVLNITLTKKHAGRNQVLPLAGIPYHAAEGYIAKLIKAGYRVAVCEQVEDPKKAKGIVKRAVTRVVSAGTVVENAYLEEKSHNFLAAVAHEKGRYGLAHIDLSTGHFFTTELYGMQALTSELARVNPAELLAPPPEQLDLFSGLEMAQWSSRVSVRNEWEFEYDASRRRLIEQFRVTDLDGFGLRDKRLAVAAAGAVISYLQETQQQIVEHLNHVKTYSPADYMILDETTQRSLELVHNAHDGSRNGTLIEVIDKTLSSMGGRMLYRWLLQPLRDEKKINKRLDAVEIFGNTADVREEIRTQLKNIPDLERIISRICCGLANPRDLSALRAALQRLPQIRRYMNEVPELAELMKALPEAAGIRDLLDKSISDEPPATLRDTGIIRDGYDTEIDELRLIRRDAKRFLAEIQEREIQRTGIKNLKIKYNKVFGYYLEVTKSYIDQVPDDFIRKQTLVNAERFITPELKEKEEQILTAEDRQLERELVLFEEIRVKLASEADLIQGIADTLATIDVYCAFAELAITKNYIRPRMTDGGQMEIKDGRHPVLDATLLEHRFVPNDLRFNSNDQQIIIITGPNMAGKSTYIRQAALITLMAHIGCFVPARSAVIPIVDRIFTRVGAMDRLARGQSTFLVEMAETANILHHSTDRSLVILDEIGRGTSTYDGISIAWAVIEYLHNKKGIRPMTLFATHYHELTDLENRLERVRNFNVAVLEKEEGITFLYKIVPGGTDHSYGIHAAELAGVPDEVVTRAWEVLEQLESNRDGNGTGKVETGGISQSGQAGDPSIQLTLFEVTEHPMVNAIKKLDLNEVTPIDALNMIQNWQKQYGDGNKK
jgi:DNA mismatch repair protein MutS